MTTIVLLVSHPEESGLARLLSESLPQLARLKVVSEENANEELSETNYNLIIVNAGAVNNAEALVSRLRRRHAASRILVITPTPAWEEARAVLRAGAVDYLSRTLTRRELGSALEAALRLPPTANS